MSRRPIDSGRRDRLGRRIRIAGPLRGTDDDSDVLDDPSDDTAELSIRSASSASDDAYIAISDIGSALAAARSRLIGGVAVVLHQERLGLTHLPVRATADADFGVPPFVLQDETVLRRINELGYVKTEGNRWVKKLGRRGLGR